MKRKLLLLLGLVLIPLGFGASVLAGSGSSSSGEYSWTFDCGAGEGEMIFTNSADSAGTITVVIPSQGHSLAPGESWTAQSNDPSDEWTISINGESGVFDSGDFSDCGEAPTTTFPPVPEGVSYTLECAEMDATVEGIEHVFANTGTVDLRIIVSLAMGTPGYNVPAGESRVIYGPAGSHYELWYEDSTVSGGYRGFGEGNLSECTGTTPPTTQPGGETPDVSPLLISECRGADWYLVNPDIDGVPYTFAYRTEYGIIYDPDYTSNNPDAISGEVMVPAGDNEVGYVDDFNVVHTATRPAECGGPATPTTAPPTTAAPGEPTTTGPTGTVIRNIEVSWSRVRHSRCRNRPWDGDVRSIRLRCRGRGQRDAALDTPFAGHRDR